ncbi:hypothetical protein Nepgr_023271 [Nepenthes gracilis]|uniref:Uncharacterized protein n=1 Tax=Nepenthes gracilis TaxID=150966 RepID=A0AAD3T2I8_NEPGR|nr:hypothetical protein Nepgr_023271 [Nepenthes gracilis]
MGNAADPMVDEDNLELEEEVDGLCRNRNNKGKVLKRILKPEREKLKHKKLNELFSNLASVLGNKSFSHERN